MNLNLDQILQIILLLLPLLPIGFIVSKLRMFEQRVVPQAEEDRIKSIVRTAVTAVEQVNSAMAGPDKKTEAIRLISQLLNEHGLKVSPALLDTLVEQSVYLLHQGQNPMQATQSVPVPPK